MLGPAEAIAETVVTRARRLGPTKRISGPGPGDERDRLRALRGRLRFGWNVVDPGHGLVFANASRTLDAAAGAPLSGSGQYGPLLLVTEAASLPAPVQDYLLDIQPGYDEDPVRGVYNHGWLMGDEAAISADVQSRIDALLEIQPVESERRVTVWPKPSSRSACAPTVRSPSTTCASSWAARHRTSRSRSAAGSGA